LATELAVRIRALCTNASPFNNEKKISRMISGRILTFANRFKFLVVYVQAIDILWKLKP
jgi:hypothetical protein